MGNFKFKLKEEKEILKPKEVDPALIQRIEKTYGPVDMENDFFSANLKTYFKTSSVDPETGSIIGVNKPTWRIYDYNFDLHLFEERINVVNFIGGNVGLMYAT